MNIILLGATGGIGECLTNELSKNNNLYLSSRTDEKLNVILN